MFLLDTNIVSEIVKRTPDAKVLARLNHEPPGSLYISSVTVFELRVWGRPVGQARLALGQDSTGHRWPLPSNALHGG